jgi:argininosuccinate lyase
MKVERLWGKRLAKEPAPLTARFTSGRDVRGILPADERLIPYDLRGSRAHVVMLAKQKILPGKVARTLLGGLKGIEDSWKKREFQLDPAKEDVHTNIESYLIRKYGIEIGGRVHTARSRNDQVALDMRLYLKDCALDFGSSISLFVEALLRHGKREKETIMPGYTHHQPAQVTTLGHIWLSFGEALLRDGERFKEWYERFNQNPLGAMTGYSTSFAIDRNLTSRLLGFDGPCVNSLDPIQGRWEAEAEMAFAITIMMNHMSSLAQTLIIMSTQEFGMFLLDDAYCSGSSMMPQKRNPDPLEIIKGKAAVAQGILVSLTSIGRSLFLGYNRDTQWSKYLIMDLTEECLPCLGIMSGVVGSLRVRKEKMVSLSSKGFIGTPDLVERLVQEWELPFRKAKIAVEKAVRDSESEGLEKVSFGALERALKEEGINLQIGEKFVLESQKAEHIVSRRKTIGGTSRQALERNFVSLEERLQDMRKWLQQKRKQENRAKNLLAEIERGI